METQMVQLKARWHEMTRYNSEINKSEVIGYSVYAYMGHPLLGQIKGTLQQVKTKAKVQKIARQYRKTQMVYITMAEAIANMINENLENPYIGNQMLACGLIKERIHLFKEFKNYIYLNFEAKQIVNRYLKEMTFLMLY